MPHKARGGYLIPLNVGYFLALTMHLELCALLAQNGNEKTFHARLWS